jgi:hypothetical protein
MTTYLVLDEAGNVLFEIDAYDADEALANARAADRRAFGVEKKR